MNAELKTGVVFGGIIITSVIFLAIIFIGLDEFTSLNPNSGTNMAPNLVGIAHYLNTSPEELTKKIMIANVREEYAFKIIDPAVVPEKKYAPSKRNIVIISFILGLFISVFSIAIITSGKKIISDYRIHTDS